MPATAPPATSSIDMLPPSEAASRQRSVTPNHRGRSPLRRHRRRSGRRGSVRRPRGRHAKPVRHEGRTARCVACMAAAISGIARPMTTHPNQPRSDEADPESETTPAGVTGDLERKAEELGATTGPSGSSATGPRQPRRRDRRSESAGTQRTGVEPPARRRRRPGNEPNAGRWMIRSVTATVGGLMEPG